MGLLNDAIRFLRRSNKQSEKPLMPENVDYMAAWNFFVQMQGAYDRMIDFLAGKVDPASTIIDVGANIGFFSLLLMERLNFTGQAHLFEPVPNLASLCVQTFVDRTWKVEVHPYALGDKNGHSVLWLAADGNIGWNTVEERKTTPGMRPQRIEVRQFDGLGIDNLGLVKIDVEGAEYSVIQGMLGTLKKQLIRCQGLPILCVEVAWGRDNHPNWEQELRVFSELRGLGYRSIDVVTQEDVDVTAITCTTDVVFLPAL